MFFSLRHLRFKEYSRAGDDGIPYYFRQGATTNAPVRGPVVEGHAIINSRRAVRKGARQKRFHHHPSRDTSAFLCTLKVLSHVCVTVNF